MNKGDHTTWTSTAGSPAHADPPVDETGQAAIADEAVALEIAVDPDRWTVVGRRSESLVPGRDGGLDVDQMARSVDRFASRLVVCLQWPSPVTRRWCAVGWHLLERLDQFREV